MLVYKSLTALYCNRPLSSKAPESPTLKTLGRLIFIPHNLAIATQIDEIYNDW